MTGLDLFCGAGGMTLGAQMAGVSVTHAVDSDAKVVKSFARNFPNARVVHRVIGEASLGALIQDLGIRRGEIDIVFGGPPCQPFSTSNLQRRGRNHPSETLWRDFMDIVRALSPAAVVIENVPGLVQRHEDTLALILETLRELTFSVRVAELAADSLGIPQTRRRIFVIAWRRKRPPPEPKGQGFRRSTVGDALSDLPRVPNGNGRDRMAYERPYGECTEYQRRLRDPRAITVSSCQTSRHTDLTLERFATVPPGGNWEDIPSDLMHTYSNPENCHRWLFRRLDAEEPSVTLGNFRKSMIIHPWQDRTLSVREAARLQGIPDWFEFEGNLQARQQQVANAVPPAMACAAIEALMGAA